MAVARAKVTARTPLIKARAVLDELLNRIDRFNADPEAVSRVDEIWLFGSMMREEATVGDIDLAICRSRDARFADDLDGQVEQAKRLIQGYPDAPQRWAWPWDRIDWLYRRSIFGPRRHPLLAGAQEGTTDLQLLAVPCRLIYDRARGGRVSDPVLPRHPESPGRANTLFAPDELPDLTPGELRPMDARWIAGFKPWGAVSPYDIFRGWTDEGERLFGSYPEHLRIVADGHDLRGFPWIPKPVSKGGLDGRNAIAIVNAADWCGTSITLRRAIEGRPGSRGLHASFTDLALYRRRKHVEISTLFDMVSAVSIILAVDAERILRRATESGEPREVTIRISSDDLPEDMRRHFAQEIADMLARRAVAIEPAGETASVHIQLA
ncbi:MAG TPA: nucleotidyltransferase domain-containing protein [Sphingopyxis sp.]|nr:nucleotidyltransferase domain-containing protein [Sphingopyxis sp.]HWV59602.1 nucleotidyltransferase domain-containing protein [Sphingopyxis sp.]